MSVKIFESVTNILAQKNAECEGISSNDVFLELQKLENGNWAWVATQIDDAYFDGIQTIVSSVHSKNIKELTPYNVSNLSFEITGEECEVTIPGVPETVTFEINGASLDFNGEVLIHLGKNDLDIGEFRANWDMIDWNGFLSNNSKEA